MIMQCANPWMVGPVRLVDALTGQMQGVHSTRYKNAVFLHVWLKTALAVSERLAPALSILVAA